MGTTVVSYDVRIILTINSTSIIIIIIISPVHMINNKYRDPIKLEILVMS